ncbi:MAG: ribonuclease P protein component [Bacteroidota bacterium]
MAEHLFTFKKKERLRHHKQIDRLFKEGIVLHNYPIKLVWLDVSAENPVITQVMFAVPKRFFKHANQRNLLKRRMREAYRLTKPSFYADLEKNQKAGIFSFVYNGKQALEFSFIQDKIILLLKRLKEIHEKAPR